MWTEASVETKHFAIATDGSSVGQWFTWNFQASAQDSLLKKKAWQLRQSLSQATIALITVCANIYDI